VIEFLFTEADEAEAKVRYLRNHYRAGEPEWTLAGPDLRWIGPIGELAVHRFLDDWQVPHVWNGGYDRKPDIEIGRVGVAVKTNTGHRDSVLIQASAIGKLADEVVFCAYDRNGRRATILGGISASGFRAEAVLCCEGKPVPWAPYRTFENDAYVLPLLALEPPLRWLDRVVPDHTKAA
jgi:hypothetical protein